MAQEQFWLLKQKTGPVLVGPRPFWEATLGRLHPCPSVRVASSCAMAAGIIKIDDADALGLTAVPGTTVASGSNQEDNCKVPYYKLQVRLLQEEAYYRPDQQRLQHANGRY